jgi:hypothetical protein
MTLAGRCRSAGARRLPKLDLWSLPMSDRMSISLVLRSPAPDRLVYALPVWYRVVMGAILAVLVAGLADAGGRPGILAWALLAIVVLAALYTEQWVFDAGSGKVTHRTGLLVAARSTVIPFAAIERFLITPHVEGTIPGTEDERYENAAALRGERGDDAGTRRARHKKPFLGLVLECESGDLYLVDRVSARAAGRLRELAARMADLCGKPLIDSEP